MENPIPLQKPCLNLPTRVLVGSREIITNLSLPFGTVLAIFHRTRLLDVFHFVTTGLLTNYLS